MIFLNWLLNLFSKKPEVSITGVRPDNRPEIEKAQDWTDKEVGSGITTLNWVEKTAYKFIETRDQGGALDCGAHAGARLVRATHQFNEMLSALPIYWPRTNYPDGGMYLKEVLEFANQGTVKESQIPSQFLHETDANIKRVLTLDEQATKNSLVGGGYVPIGPRDIDSIASLTENDKPVVLLIWFYDDEWQENFEVLHPGRPYGNTIGHFVVAVDYTLKNGKKYLVIEDSSNLKTSLNSKGQRLMSENFLNQRCVGTGYLLKRGESIKFTFTKDLQLGDNDQDVKFLQQYLNNHGFLVASSGPGSKGQETTYFGNLTKSALALFQMTHNIKPSVGYFGPLTRAYINSH